MAKQTLESNRGGGKEQARPPSSSSGPPLVSSRSVIHHLGIWVVIGAVLAAIWFLSPVHLWAAPILKSIRLYRVQSEVEALMHRWGPWAPLVSIALMILHDFIPFPAEFLAIANGAAFGLWLGSLVQWAGSMAGAVVGFAIARALRRPVVERYIPKRAIEWMDNQVRISGWQVSLLIRFVPFLPFALVNYALGVTRLRWGTYLWTTAVSLVPWSLATVSVGVGAVRARDILPWSLSGLAALAGAGFAARWYLARRARRRRPGPQ
jgi:uncharacterized membrane protein YdjX (TVP38/TMEM64 family)